MQPAYQQISIDTSKESFLCFWVRSSYFGFHWHCPKKTSVMVSLTLKFLDTKVRLLCFSILGFKVSK